MRTALSGLLKIGLSLGIIVFLVVRATQDQAFARLMECPKNWPLLGLAAGLLLLGTMLLHVRWYLLTRALDLPVSLREAMRVGFLGYLFNFLPMGVVAGDVLKVVLLGRRLQGSGARITATVMVDRLMGLFLLFLAGSIAIAASGFWRISDAAWAVSVATVALTAVGGLGLAVLAVPAITGTRVRWLLRRMPYAGATLVRLTKSLDLYRRNGGAMAACCLLSLLSVTLTIGGIHFIDRALYAAVPTFGQHYVAGTVAGTTGVIPLSFGPFEAVFEFLYVSMGMPVNHGFIVALAWRILTLVIAIAGVGFFVLDRRDAAAAEGQDEELAGVVKSAA